MKKLRDLFNYFFFSTKLVFLDIEIYSKNVGTNLTFVYFQVRIKKNCDILIPGAKVRQNWKTFCLSYSKILWDDIKLFTRLVSEAGLENHETGVH